jgi:tetratricopeptide (TPR) repeat protein
MSFPIARRNPYIIGRPITEANLFFGRESLFQFVADNLYKGSQVILLHGQRRIGKSSVLAQIPNFVDLENFVFVPLSLEGDSQKPLGEVLHELARDSLEHFGLIGSIVLPSITELEHDPKIFVDRFLLQLRHALKTQNLVLLLDEFDAFYSLKVAAGHLFQYFQSEVYHHPDLYIIPVVGRQLNDLPELVSLFREAPNQEVGLLDRRNAERLITMPAEGLLDYSQDAIDAILELSAGHPYFTQVVCFAVFSHAREEDRWQVTRADVESIVEKAIELGEGGLAWFWDGLPIPERVVFSAAAEVPEAKLVSDQLANADLLNFTQEEPLALLRDRGVILTPPLHDAVFNLVDWKFLQSVGSKSRPTGTSIPPRISTFRVTIELVRRWLIRRHALQHEVWELERLNPEVDRLYQEIKKARPFGVTLSIISRLTPILAANPNHFGALFEMAECLMEIRNFSQAVKYYDRAYRVDSVRAKDGFLQALWDYGDELREEGHLKEARGMLKQALEIVPDSPEIHQVLEEICKEEKYSDYLIPSPSFVVNPREFLAEEVPEIALTSDLTALEEKFSDVWELVEDKAPSDVKDRALERLDELKEIFTTQELNLTTMAYVQQWFMKHVPAPLNEAVSHFLEEIISKVIKGKTNSK